MQFRKSSFAGIRCTCIYFSNGFTKTTFFVLRVKKLFEIRLALLFAGRDICADSRISCFHTVCGFFTSTSLPFTIQVVGLKLVNFARASKRRANKLRFHCCVLDISLAEEKNVGINCFRFAL